MKLPAFVSFLLILLAAETITSDGVIWNPPPGEKVVCVKQARLKANCPPHLVVWSKRQHGSAVRVLRRFGNGWAVDAESLNSPVWRLEIGDVNSDGLDEIVVGLWMRSKLDPKPGRRIYVYALNAREHSFRPLWRGTSLSRPFRDFFLVRVNGRSDLAAIESLTGPPREEYIAVYSWDDFGFRIRWDSIVMGRITGWKRLPSPSKADKIILERTHKGKRQTLELTLTVKETYSSRTIR